MIGELNVYGVFLPALMLCVVLAVLATAGVRAVFRRIGVYRLAWHPALFDLSLFVILLGVVVALTSQ